MEHRSYTQKNRRGAFTLAEFLVVISITMILAGVSFVAAIRYQSRLRRMEMDRTAKEIFLAAQNNLSLAKSGGIMERLLHQDSGDGTGSGTSEDEADASADKIGIALTKIAGDTGADTDGLYYILYQPGEDADNATEEIRERLLPFGSIDETVRTDGSYLIIYNPEAGAVREVWYSDRYVFQGTTTEFSELTEIAEDPEKRERFHGSPVGHYAGDSLTEPGRKDPDSNPVGSVTMELHNEDILYAVVKDNNIGFVSNYTLRMWIEGLSSGATGWFELSASNARVDKEATIVLDDITTDGLRFADFNSDSSLHFEEDGMQFIPGEDIRVYVDSVSNETGKIIAVSSSYQTNSIFQGITGGRAQIASIRHLENLDKRISEFDPDGNAEQLGLQTSQPDGAYMAVQQADISWAGFCLNVAKFYFNPDEVDQKKEQIAVRYVINNTTSWSKPGSFAPLEPSYELDYEGNTHAINDLRVNNAGAGGCFGTVTKNLTVENLVITHPDITSDDNAGGLIGYGKKDESSLDISVENVLVQYPVITSKGVKRGTETKAVDAGALIGAFNGTTLTVKSVMAANTYRTRVSDAASVDQNPPVNAEAFKIEAETGAAGGLIGSVTGNVTLSGCAASVYVDAESYAGGLVANVNTPASGTPEVLIENCYVAGHTANGACQTDLYPGAEGFDTAKGRYNIVSTGELAGGLAAVLPAGSNVKRSYVTASVWSKGMYTADEAEATAFVTKYGKMNSGETITGKKASDFSYCYSSSVVSGGVNADGTILVKGKEILDYSNTDKLEKYFAENATFTKKQAFPYDTTLTSTYPMPTILQLMQEDPETSSTIRNDTGEGTSQSKQIFRFSRVHVGDWLKGKKETVKEGLTLKNGNRLWADYVIDMPEGTDGQMQYVSFSIYGVKSKKTVYYLIAFDKTKLDQALFYTSADANKIISIKNGADTNAWKKAATESNHRLELTSEENGKKLKIRLIIDSKAFKNADYQYLNVCDYNFGSTGQLIAGEDIVVHASKDNIIPDGNDAEDSGNSFFESIVQDENKVWNTAVVTNSRNLINLNFCDSEQLGITKVKQADNILWKPDPDNIITANTEPYCQELSQAYPDVPVQIFNGEIGGGYTEPNGFMPIENTDLISYDGDRKTIAELQINNQQWSKGGSALFLKNKHLTVKNLNLKDPDIQDVVGNAAGIIAVGGVDSWENNTQDTFLELYDICIYGNRVKIQGASAVGGIAARIKVQKLVMENVSFYGENALIGGEMIQGKTGNDAAGGLVGGLNAESMRLSNCMFSGYLSGKYFQKGVGGLIGDLDLSRFQNGPDKKTPLIENCYVAGRNRTYKNGALTDLADLGDDVYLRSEFNISGKCNVGGLVGTENGILEIKNSFSMAGVFGYAGQGVWQSGTGGLIGKCENSSNPNIQNCYFGGNVNKDPNGEGAGARIGYLVGTLDVNATDFKITNCAYADRVSTIYPMGSVNASISGAANSLDPFKTPATGPWIDAAPYDDSLPKTYPYMVWTTESGKTIYRGDWIQ